MGSGNILRKFELDQIIFLDFRGIESLKYKEIRVSGAKLFLRSIEYYKGPTPVRVWKYSETCLNRYLSNPITWLFR